MNPPMVWIDTNIIIRFITADHPTMTPEVAQLMKKTERGQIRLKVPSLVIAECCWVLESSLYDFSRSDIANVLTAFLVSEGIEMDEKDVVLSALNMYSRSSVDYVDAYLAALAKNEGSAPIVTFNSKDFKKLNVNFCRPGEVQSHTT